jgi:hypothetical protein
MSSIAKGSGLSGGATTPGGLVVEDQLAMEILLFFCRCPDHQDGASDPPFDISTKGIRLAPHARDSLGDL